MFRGGFDEPLFGVPNEQANPQATAGTDLGAVRSAPAVARQVELL